MPVNAASATLEENKENIPPSRTKNIGENGDLPKPAARSQTIPRHRRPLEQLDRNAILPLKKPEGNAGALESTPSLHSEQEARRQCVSAPAAAPVGSKVGQEDLSSKRLVNALEGKGEDRQKRIKPWRFQDSEADAKQVASILDLDPSESAGKISDLFKKLEAEGKLSQKVLQFFAHCPFIATLNLAPSYAGKLNEIGLLAEPAFDPTRCTVPLYAGYRNLKALDMTNVLIGDDEIRYLIKLESLEALGLSGTGITAKGLKYLSVHAKFSKSLTCLKLCYAQKIGDEAILAIAGFERLQELDLLGADISIAGCLELAPNARSSLQRLRLPSNAMQYLYDMNAYFSDKKLDELGASNVGTHRLKEMLKIFKRKYQDVFLSTDAADIRRALDNLLARRRREELLWSIAKDSYL